MGEKLNKFGVGDIVENVSNNSDRTTLYMVTDVVCLSDAAPTTYEIVQIYPILLNEMVGIVEESRLRLYAKLYSSGHLATLSEIRLERKKKGLPPDSESVEIALEMAKINTQYEKQSENEKPKSKKSAKKKAKFDANGIKRILSDDTAEKQVEEYKERLDQHLKLLFVAMTNNDEKEIEFQKSQLEKVRQALMELEYFQMVDKKKHRY